VPWGRTTLSASLLPAPNNFPTCRLTWSTGKKPWKKEKLPPSTKQRDLPKWQIPLHAFLG